ncbi:UNVERIFIED_ORG: hypothetical protein BDK47_1784, partial [Anoxybacillus amylolyticus]
PIMDVIPIIHCGDEHEYRLKNFIPLNLTGMGSLAGLLFYGAGFVFLSVFCSPSFDRPAAYRCRVMCLFVAATLSFFSDFFIHLVRLCVRVYRARRLVGDAENRNGSAIHCLYMIGWVCLFAIAWRWGMRHNVLEAIAWNGIGGFLFTQIYRLIQKIKK